MDPAAPAVPVALVPPVSLADAWSLLLLSSPLQATLSEAAATSPRARVQRKEMVIVESFIEVCGLATARWHRVELPTGAPLSINGRERGIPSLNSQASPWRSKGVSPSVDL
jgi:hypothetical protein